MKFSSRFSPASGALLAVILPLVFGVAQNTLATVLWTGPTTNFTQSSSNLVDELIPGAVSLTRFYSQWLFNPDAGDQGPATGTPTDTEWAFGLLTNYTGLQYQTFDAYRNGDLSALLVSNAMVVHLINEEVYLSLTFSAWPQHGGFFAYTRSIPTPAENVPFVNINQPTNGAVFAAPANLSLTANATVAIGSITNVAFYANSNLLGTVQSSPFGINGENLVAGQYALTAVATAAGISATSPVVNVTIVSAIAPILSSPRITNGQFAFDYTVNPGDHYVVQNSSNLVDWLSLATNVPTSNSVHFTQSVIPTGVRYYRVGRLPNP